MNSDALVVVDVQQLLVDRLAPERRGAFIAVLHDVLRRARATRTPVVYIRHEDQEELFHDSRGWQIAAEIAPQSGEPVVDKRFRDAFRETRLADVLAGFGARHLIVCGMQTEFCVDATLREAERRGYRVTLVADGHATFSVEGATEEQIRDQVHRVAAGRIADIVPSAAVLA